MFRLQPHNWAEARTFLSANPPETPPPGTEPQRRSSADVLTQYGNDAVRMADRVATLEGENYRYREQRRELQDEVKALKANQKPEGAVILTGDEATAYGAYRELGKPDEIKTWLDERQSLSTQVATAQRDGTLRDAAGAAGFKFAVLKDRAGDLPIEIREVEVEGKKVNRAFVKPEGGQEAELTAYAEQHWGDYLPALQATEQGSGQRSQGNGVAFPAQQSSQAQRQVTGPQVAGNYVTSTYQGPPKRS